MTPHAPSVAVVCPAAADAALAGRLAAALGVVLTAPGEFPKADLSLTVEAGALFLRDNRSRGLKPLCIDLESPETPSKKQPLGRAVGRKTGTVVDATAGWGDDTRRLCAMGYSVTAIERNPVMAALLENAADRARLSGRDNIPDIVAGDAIEHLAAHPGRWDCVYLDPMFPPKPRASTLARRPMRLLRELAGDDADKPRLFEAARAGASKRIVVKRPDHAAPMFPGAAEVISGKLVCYDVYHLAT